MNRRIGKLRALRYGRCGKGLTQRLVAVGCLLTVLAGGAVAQTLTPPPGPGSTTMPPGAMSVPQVTVEPDTALAVLTGLDEAWQPLHVYVVPDTIVFGDPIHVVLDLPAAAPPTAADSLASTASWLAPPVDPDLGFWQRLAGKLGLGADTEAPALQDLPAPDGDEQRRLISWRIYRTQPFRLQVGEHVSAPITVLGRAEGLGQVAAIRRPRGLGYDLQTLLLGALILTLLSLAMWALWRLRYRGDGVLGDWSVPGPAWLSVAVDLQRLLADDLLARGESRTFLDRLAGLIRTYVSGRYRIAAREMTGAEIVAACRRLGYDGRFPGRFARLIDDLDRHRYDPAALDSAWCRARCRELLATMAEVRILPRYGDVPAELQLAADKAWSNLVCELDLPPATATTAPVAVGPGGGR